MLRAAEVAGIENKEKEFEDDTDSGNFFPHSNVTLNMLLWGDG